VYTVTLIVKNRSGENSVRKTDYITVYPYPTANFTADLTLACAPATIHFTDHSIPGQGSISGWSWDFGDGGASTGQSPAYTYSQPGYYTVRLTATNSQGCSNTLAIARYIRLVSGVQPDFAWDQTSTSCSAPFVLNFINQTSGPGNLNYSWDLGNGVISAQQSPSTTYPSNIDYKITLTATSDLGCSQSIQKTISFPGGNPIITSPDSACANTPISFKNGSVPAPVSSAWDFGDGSFSTATNPSKSYPTPSAYTVKLVNKYSTCADSISKIVQIVSSPVADFTADKKVSCKAPLTVSFQGISTPPTSVASWLWDFGDGSTSSLQSPSHNYTTAGSFDVKLTITNTSGCSGTITKSQFIQIAPPVVNIIQLPGQVCTGAGFSPVADIATLDGVASYSWTASGGSPATSTSPNPTFTYATQGNYDLTLSVTTNDGCTTPAILFSDAVIVGDPVVPHFTISPTTSCANQPITFTSDADPAKVNYWFWYWGDNTDTGRTGPVITHSYNDSGDFKVIMRTISHGCTQFAPAYQIVHINAPIANFGYQAECIDRHIIDFKDSSKIDLTKGAPTYLFNYGDGNSSGTITGNPPIFPPHTYAAYGTYTVTLTVTNGPCSDVISKPVVVSAQAPDFTIDPVSDSVCKNAPFTLTVAGIDTNFIRSYDWNVGGAITSAGPVFQSSLPATGNYPLGLTITDINGCVYSSLPVNPHTLVVTGPAALFTPANLIAGLAGGCRNTPIFFTDQSTPYGPGYPIVTWTWNFRDGGTVDFNAPPFSHSYTDTGSYTVVLTVTDSKNCNDSYAMPTFVQITGPQAGFFTTDTAYYCPNAPLPFTDSSKGYNLSWAWDFGDGNTSTLQNPTNKFPTSGQKYSVKLKVTDQVGCSDSLTRVNYITIQKPIPDFSIADSTTICPPLQTTFTPNAQFYDSLYWDFGDGTTSTLPNTTHFYNTYDTFYAKLILRGPGGCLDSATRRILVLDPHPGQTTSFTYNPLTACDSVLTTFDIVAPGYTRWNLLFGDGQSDSSQMEPVVHMYRIPFVYQPQLILQDPTGCIFGIGAIGGNIKVLGATPFFSIDRHEFCDSGVVNFSDFTITNDGIVSKTWVFGDGTPDFVSPTPALEVNPQHDYTTPGILLPTLKVTTQSNCAENYTDTIRIHQTPHPVFTIANPSCITVPIQFLGNLTIPNTTDILTWSWNFGDGQTANVQDPVITYPKSGNYTVSLKVSVPFGCSDTITQTIPAFPLPSIKGPAGISTPVGFPVTIPFTYSTNILSYAWTPVTDLSCPDCSNPVATPIFSTTYHVVVTDSNHCVSYDSILVKTVCNEKNYFIPNTFSPNGDGVNDVFYPRGKSLYNVQSMRVFNRWGQKVFEKRDFPANTQSEGWDGTINGQLAPVDAYVYIIEVICENAQIIALKGDVTLVR